MKNKLPTRDECLSITEQTDAFYRTERIVEGQRVELYDYRLASLSDFTEYNAFELRGICFVYDEDTDKWDRNILLNKFFNVNQTDGWMYEDVKDKTISRVQNKEDGSIISFVKFKNGKVRAKSKMSFESDQAVMAQELYDNDSNLQAIIDDCFKIGCTPIFELVGPKNQIVVEYFKNELVLLQLRNEDGSYYEDLNNMADSYGVHCADAFTNFQVENVSLQYLLDEKESNQDNIEGWVVTFDDGQMAKIKTDHYLSLHSLIGPDAFRENLLVKTIIDGNIDDVISALVPSPKKGSIIELNEKVSHEFNRLVVEFMELRLKYFQDFNEVRKDFAIKHSKDSMFSGVMKTLNESHKDIEKIAETQVKLYIERNTKSLGDAKEWCKNLQNG